MQLKREQTHISFEVYYVNIKTLHCILVLYLVRSGHFGNVVHSVRSLLIVISNSFSLKNIRIICVILKIAQWSSCHYCCCDVSMETQNVPLQCDLLDPPRKRWLLQAPPPPSPQWIVLALAPCFLLARFLFSTVTLMSICQNSNTVTTQMCNHNLHL